MFKGSLFGLKPAASAMALLLIAAGLYFGACSKDEEKGTEKVEETESVEVETTEESAVTPAPEADKEKGERAEGLPPEITEPCSGKNEGDACVVTATGGMEIKGTCIMTKRNILGCNPEPIPGKKKPGSRPATPEPSESQ
ncbi:MAG: hypothetical protein AB1598_05485 [Thermodesulfobacteriota bacterium]